MVSIFTIFKKEGVVDRKEKEIDMDPVTDEEAIEDVRLENKIQHHWRMVFKDNGRGLDGDKSLVHTNRWYDYMNKKQSIIKGGYYVKVSGSDGKKVVW